MNPRILLAAPLLLLALPVMAADVPRERTGHEVYDAVCSSCHATGVKGAPKSGDKDAWIPRMKRGLNELALAAIRGHGGMPARGGHAELTDPEVRAAITYMFDPGAEARAAARPAPIPPSQGPNQAVANGLEIHIGLMAAEQMRAYPRDSPEALMHGGVPAGAGYQHVNVTVFDAGNHAPIHDAWVEVEVSQPGTVTQKKRLEPMRSQNAASYGEYVKLASRIPANVTVRIKPAGVERVTEARFTPTPD